MHLPPQIELSEYKFFAEVTNHNYTCTISQFKTLKIPIINFILPAFMQNQKPNILEVFILFVCYYYRC